MQAPDSYSLTHPGGKKRGRYPRNKVLPLVGIYFVDLCGAVSVVAIPFQRRGEWKWTGFSLSLPQGRPWGRRPPGPVRLPAHGVRDRRAPGRGGRLHLHPPHRGHPGVGDLERRPPPLNPPSWLHPTPPRRLGGGIETRVAVPCFVCGVPGERDPFAHIKILFFLQFFWPGMASCYDLCFDAQITAQTIFVIF